MVSDPPDVLMSHEDLQSMFDMATGSMNFMSGFLVTDEVELLRRVAHIIGVDPKVATPSEFYHAFGYGCFTCDSGYGCRQHPPPVDPTPKPIPGAPVEVFNIAGDFATGREVNDAKIPIAGSELQNERSASGPVASVGEQQV
jgi:hypothetical protein